MIHETIHTAAQPTPPRVVSSAAINAEIVPPQWQSVVRDALIEFWHRGRDSQLIELLEEPR